MTVKKIHYCWFGGNPLPELALKCIESWKKFLPDYEIIEWNESNFNVNAIPYSRDAYNSGKYAFVSDYARFHILNEFGGLYLDTDVELIKPLGDILDKGPFMGIESAGNINPGLGFFSLSDNPLLTEILNEYKSLSFINNNGSYNLTTIVDYTSYVLRKHGLKDSNEFQKVAGFNIYPSSYFNPIVYETKQIKLSEETYSIHHFAGTWCEPPSMKIRTKVFLANILGKSITEAIRKITHKHDKYKK